MSGLRDALQSTVGRKVLVALFGLLFVGFLVMHLLANLTLLIPDGGASFNSYAAALANWGPALYAAEAVLAILFLGHAVAAMRTAMANAQARKTGYAVQAPAGGPSRKGTASMTMKVGGPILLVYLVWHLWTLKFADSPTTVLHGEEVRDLSASTVAFFTNPIWVLLYLGVMAVLFLHLKHGLWSALQSLGLGGRTQTPKLQKLSDVVAAVMAGGFAIIPLWIYVREVLL